MPKVGKKHFSYSMKGRKAAASYAKKTGVNSTKKKKVMALNEKRQRFIDEYLIDMNASQAAIRAGYSCHRANQTGYFLMTNVDIKKEIDRKMIEKAEKLDISREKILSLLMEEALNSEI